MRRLFRSVAQPLIVVGLILLVFACSGGGCASCAGCGILPIPGGFPIADRIDNSAQVRLTQSGVTFIQDNITPIVGTFLPGGLDFPVPMSSGAASIAHYDLCPSGDCTVHAEIESLTLTPTPPRTLAGHLRMRLWSRDTAMHDRAIPVHITSGCAFGFCLIDTTCQANIDTRVGSRDYIGLVFDIDFTAIPPDMTHAARAGYTEIQVTTATLATGEDLEDADVNVGMCSGVSGAILGAFIPLFKSTLITQLQTQVNTLIQSQVQSQLCTKAGTTGCPTGTFADGAGATAICRYGAASSSECVSTLLGTDGQGDLGNAFLGGFSPGTHGPGQILLASGGDGEAVNNGMSLFMYGGFRGTDPTFTTSPAHNSCVPVIAPPPLPTIPRVDSFRGNVIPGTTTTTHVAFGLAQDYMNYAAYGAFDGGLLCLGAGTRLSQQLSTGLLSALISSLNSLTFPNGSSAVAINVRPQQPPHIVVGTAAGEPLLDVMLPQMDLDFYVWSEERYVRFMTYQADLEIGIDLQVMDGMIVPHIGSLNATNATVTNSDLLTEDPTSLASLVTTILNSFATMLTGAIPPIALPAISGFDLMVPPGGLTGIADSGENFLGIFANLAIHPAGTPLSGTVDTSLVTSDLHIQRAGMDVAHFGQGDLPHVSLEMNANGSPSGAYEYSYRIDGAPWSAWQTDRRVTISDQLLFLQARHVIEARARVAGQIGSQDPTPATTEVLVDILAPQVQSAVTGTRFAVTASDVVTPPETLQYRYRVTSSGTAGAWSAWSHSATFDVPPDADSVDGEVRDESDNVAGTHADLIRGLPDPLRTGGCHCSVDRGNLDAGDLSTFGLLALALCLSTITSWRRRARRSLPRRSLTRKGGSALAAIFFVIALPLVFGVAGCDCGGGTHAMDGSVPHDGPAPDTGPADCGGMCGMTFAATGGFACCPMTNMCVMYSNLDGDCMPGSTCMAASDLSFTATSCIPHCSMCVPKPPLRPGQLATFLDMAVAADGTPILSGYSAGVPVGAAGLRYGDLVVGPWNATGTPPAVTWATVDGVPAGPVDHDPSGWRHGISAAGDDDGQFSSIALHGMDVYVSYYDATHRAVKFAHEVGELTSSWMTQTVDMQAGGLAGQWTSVAVTNSGAPAISYLKVVPPTGEGKPSSHVAVAIAHSANPMATTDWTIYDVGHADVSCRAGVCNAGQACLMTGECVTPTTDCPTACAMTEACHMGACATTLPDPWVEDYPPWYGLHTELATTSAGLALVWYDRSAGQIDGASFDGSMWGTPFVIDGYGSGHAGAGDSGIGASIFIDGSGAWHVSYVDGAEETLRYAVVTAGAVTSVEIVDDGSTDGTMHYPDGRHVIGDDSSIVVTAGGEVRIAYQDATSQTVMFAKKASGGAWVLQVLDNENSTGYFVEQQLVGNVSYVATWWRDQTMMNANGVRILMAGS